MTPFTSRAFKRTMAIGLTAGALYVPILASAQPAPAEAPAAPRAADREPTSGKHGPELTLRANASNEIMQDSVSIVLAVETEAKYQEAAGKQLTAALDDVVKRAKGTKGVDVRTGSNNVWAEINDKGKTTGWRGRAEVRLESRDFAAASALATKLGDASAITSVTFSLSREARAREEKRLLAEAAGAFKDRALAAANAFGFSGYRLEKLELGGSGADMSPPRPMMMSRQSAKADGPNVPLEPDNELVTIDVNGTIVLQ